MYRWNFNVFMPSLISKKLLGKVQIIISDSDIQFFIQIDSGVSVPVPVPYSENDVGLKCPPNKYPNIGRNLFFLVDQILRY